MDRKKKLDSLVMLQILLLMGEIAIVCFIFLCVQIDLLKTFTMQNIHCTFIQHGVRVFCIFPFLQYGRLMGR